MMADFARARPIGIAILGLGGRGLEVYADWISRHAVRARVAAVAEPRADLQQVARGHLGVDPCRVFGDWSSLADDPPADVEAIIVALPDDQHVEATIGMLGLGVPLLVEKPVATTASDLARLVRHVPATTQVAVAHVLRFSPFWRVVREVVHAGVIGDVRTIRLEENIGFWHFAHSYVRGNWRDPARCHSLALAKNCHDFDLIRWLLGSAPDRVSSFGSSGHFAPESAPQGATANCSDDCPAAGRCPYHAPSLYLQGRVENAHHPRTVFDMSATGPGGGPTDDPVAALTLAGSDYDRCVFGRPSHIVDHQQTLMQFASGATAVLSTSAFTGQNTRDVRITGTEGEIAGRMDEGHLTLDQFVPTAPTFTSLNARAVGQDVAGPMGHRRSTFSVVGSRGNVKIHRGHGGGDDGLMDSFVAWASRQDHPGQPVADLAGAVDGHMMAFLAERSRRSGATVSWPDQDQFVGEPW